LSGVRLVERRKRNGIRVTAARTARAGDSKIQKNRVRCLTALASASL
jgi:hypothetical protein